MWPDGSLWIDDGLWNLVEAQMMNFTAYTSPEGFACMVGKEAESTCSNMNSDVTSCYNTRSYEKTVSLRGVSKTGVRSGPSGVRPKTLIQFLFSISISTF